MTDWRLISSLRHPCWRKVISKNSRRENGVYAALQTVTVASVLQLHSWMPSQYFMDEVRRYWLGPRISAMCALHYSLPSLVAGLICVDKGLDGRMWFSLCCADSTIFIPALDSAALEWHHSSIFMLNHLYGAGSEVDLHLNLFPVRTHQLHIHADYHWTECCMEGERLHLSTNALKCHVCPTSLAGWSHGAKQLFSASLGAAM